MDSFEASKSSMQGSSLQYGTSKEGEKTKLLKNLLLKARKFKDDTCHPASTSAWIRQCCELYGRFHFDISQKTKDGISEKDENPAPTLHSLLCRKPTPPFHGPTEWDYGSSKLRHDLLSQPCPPTYSRDRCYEPDDDGKYWERILRSREKHLVPEQPTNLQCWRVDQSDAKSDATPRKPLASSSSNSNGGQRGQRHQKNGDNSKDVVKVVRGQTIGAYHGKVPTPPDGATLYWRCTQPDPHLGYCLKTGNRFPVTCDVLNDMKDNVCKRRCHHRRCSACKYDYRYE